MTEELVKYEAQYPVLATDAHVADLIKENLGGTNFSAFDLEKVGIPTGGGIKWTLQTLTGEIQVPVLEGIIVLFQDCRAYWAKEFSGDTPPDCASEDGRTGYGTPGGKCLECPMSQFGSDIKGGRGQACKQIRRLFVLRPRSYLPIMVALPPTSIKASKQYLTRVTNAGLPYWGVITELSLQKTKNQTGIAYSKVAFQAAQKDGQLVRLSDEEQGKVREFAKALKAVLSARAFTPEEFVVE